MRLSLETNTLAHRAITFEDNVMTKVLIALTLTFAAQASFAQGFSPWQDRAITHEMGSAPAANLEPTGFAPWRDRETVMDLPSAASSSMSDAFGSAFRPWS